MQRSSLLRVAAALLAAGGTAAAQQPTFSIDFHGPTNAATPCGAGGPVIQEGDILEPNTPARDPSLAAPAPVCVRNRGGGFAGMLGLPAYPGACEVDALSYGADAPLQVSMAPGSVKFSVDEHALGDGTLVPPVPSVATEAPAGDSSASTFVDLGLPALPLAPGAPSLDNVEVMDGDGLPSLTSHTAPGLGLVEPNPAGFAPDAGDNLDALDADGVGAANFVLFSLDGGFFDPLSAIGGSGSAVANGFLPSQILASNLSGAPPIVWATAGQLGLVLGGAADDIDALAVWDNGNKVYDPASAPFDWNDPAPSDMVLFSLRRGSATIGAIDSLYGAQIEEGDVLMPPVAGGVSGNPAIVIPAEALGLATRRNGTALFFAGQFWGDDLDALDVTDKPLFDCNGNGREDAIDIVDGTECDANLNGVPDSCETVTYCTAGTSASGCQALIAASGIASATAPSGFVLSASNVEGDKDGTFYFGKSGRQANPWGNGSSYQCVVPPVRRGGPMTGTGTAGLCDGTFSLDLNAVWCPTCPRPGKNPGLGSTVQAQLWYRDPGNTSSQTTSLSNAVEFVICP